MRGGEKSGWLIFFWVFGGHGCTGRVSSSETLHFLILGFFGVAEQVAEWVICDIKKSQAQCQYMQQGLLCCCGVPSSGLGEGDVGKGNTAQCSLYMFTMTGKKII